MSEGRTAGAERGSDEGDRGMLRARRAQRAREGAEGAGQGIVAMRCAVRRARPETDSDVMHVSCHVNQAWRRRQEEARGDGHLRRHP